MSASRLSTFTDEVTFCNRSPSKRAIAGEAIGIEGREEHLEHVEVLFLFHLYSVKPYGIEVICSYESHCSRQPDREGDQGSKEKADKRRLFLRNQRKTLL